MKQYEQHVEGYENKFIITEERAYFVPYTRGMAVPKIIEILGEIFDLNNPEVVRDVDGRIFGGRIILGYFDPSTREVVIHTPLETSDYVERRMREVFNV